MVNDNVNLWDYMLDPFFKKIYDRLWSLLYDNNDTNVHIKARKVHRFFLKKHFDNFNGILDGNISRGLSMIDRNDQMSSDTHKKKNYQHRKSCRFTLKINQPFVYSVIDIAQFSIESFQIGFYYSEKSTNNENLIYR